VVRIHPGRPEEAVMCLTAVQILGLVADQTAAEVSRYRGIAEVEVPGEVFIHQG
jgi:hypothetical protein